MWNSRGVGSPSATRVSVAAAIGIVVLFLLSSLSTAGAAGTPAGASTTNDSANLVAAAEASLGAGDGPAGGSPAQCASVSGASATCTPSSPLPPGSPTAANTTGGEWVPVNYSRAYTSLAYDGRDAYVVAFGGMDAAGHALGDTWKYAEGGWTLLLTSTAPSPRWGAAMDYDDSSSSIILFGGTNGTAVFNDTWAYSGGIWTNVTTSHDPSPRAFAGMTYDANTSDGYSMMFGGADGATLSLNQTWEYHAGAWSILTSSGPPALKGSSLAFDNHIGYAVLYGGVLSGGTYSSATWEYRGGVWRLGPTGPPKLAFAGMAFDRAPNVKALVLFGGTNGVTTLDGTWELINETWTPESSGTLPARAGVALTFDGLHPDFYIVLWGGLTSASPSTAQSDTWNYTGPVTGWNEVTPGGHPPALTGASLVNLPNQNEVVLFGGLGALGYSDATYIFQGGSWTLDSAAATAPSARAYSASTYDAALGAVILFGGVNTHGTYLNDTWEFTGGVTGTWTNLTSSLTGPTPSARDYSGIAYEAAPNNEVVLFGGTNGPDFFNDTWTFSGTAWANVTPIRSPNQRADPMMTFDGVDGYVLLFGGYNNSPMVFGDTWVFHPTTLTWSELTPATPPSARLGSRAAYDPFNGYVVMAAGASTFTTSLNDTNGFIGGTWTPFSPPLSPPARYDAALSYDRGDKYIVQFGGYNYTTMSAQSDTWLWVAFSAEATAAPNPTDVGVPVDFGVSAVAGIGHYTYNWSYGDGSSSGPITVPPVHTYLTAGTYNASVTVTDQRTPTPDQTTANVTVIVNPMLTVVASATPDAGAPGTVIEFNATISGGTRPLTEMWVFGDHTAAVSGQNVTHAYSATGTYNATIFVNETSGALVAVNETVTVRIATLAAQVCARNSPMVSACTTSTTTDVGVPVIFNSTHYGGVAPYTVKWLFGDGGSSTLNNTTYAYATTGTYAVDFWINDSASNHFFATLTVTVVPLPTASVQVAPNPTDTGVTVVFNSTVLHGTPAFTYLWTFGDGGTATTANATHAYTTAGTFSVSFVVTDAVGEMASGTSSVTVVAGPSVSASATPSPSEVGVSVAFTASVTGGSSPVSVAWVFGDGSHGTGATASHTYAASGTFTATAWANDSAGLSAHDTVTVTVNAAISSTATASPSTADVGVPVTFTGASTGGVGAVSYAWSFGDGTAGTGASPTHAYVAPGTYKATLWANDSLAASGTSSTIVTVVGDPAISGFSVSSSSVSSGGSVTFSATVSGGTAPYSYAYTGLPAGCASTNAASLTCSPSATGSYTVHLEVTDAQGKTANSTVSLDVTSSTSSTFLGLPALYGYLLLALIVVIIAALVIWLVVRRGKAQSTEAPPPSGAEASTAPGTQPKEPEAEETGDSTPTTDESEK
ncbi:MAG: PKD domain-containing protein [Thermoplasmata archaeon]